MKDAENPGKSRCNTRIKNVGAESISVLCWAGIDSGRNRFCPYIVDNPRGIFNIRCVRQDMWVVSKRRWRLWQKVMDSA